MRTRIFIGPPPRPPPPAFPASSVRVTPRWLSAAVIRSTLKSSTPRQMWLMSGLPAPAELTPRNCGPPPICRFVVMPWRLITGMPNKPW